MTIEAKPPATVEYRTTHDPSKAGVRYYRGNNDAARMGPVYAPYQPGRTVITVYQPKPKWWEVWKW